MSKRRSTRLLKKLKLGKLQEFVFPFSAGFTKEIDMQAQEQLTADLLEEVIENTKNSTINQSLIYTP